MKKTILAIAAFAIFTVGNSFAQSRYQSKGHDAPVYSNAKIGAPVDAFEINNLDNIVNLTRKQESEIKKLEIYYDRVVKNSREIQTLKSIKRLESQKQKDILEVLTPLQRQKLLAYQNGDKFNNRNKWDNSNSKYNRKG